MTPILYFAFIMSYLNHCKQYSLNKKQGGYHDNECINKENW